MPSTAACPSGGTWLLFVIKATRAMRTSSLAWVCVPRGLCALLPEPHAHLSEQARGRLEMRPRGLPLAKPAMDLPQSQSLARGERLAVRPERLARLGTRARDVAEQGSCLGLVALLAEALGEVEGLARERMRLLDPSAEEETLRPAREEGSAMALDAELLEEAEPALEIAQRPRIGAPQPRAHQSA